MSFFNEKWKNSSIMTKAAAWILAFTTLLLLICTITVLSLERTILSMMESDAPFIGYWFFYLFFLVFCALFSFGIFKVSKIARFFVIITGLGPVISIIFLFTQLGDIMTLVRETVGAGTVDAAIAASSAGMGFAARMFADVLLPLIPAAVLVRIGFYLFVFTTPMVFYVLATLILLLFCGKDFRRKKEVQPAT